MRKIYLKICFSEKNITKTLQFKPSLKVCDAFSLIREKFCDLNLGNEEDYGLYIDNENIRKGIWLDSSQSLEYYLLRDGDSLEYKRKTRSLRVKKLDGSVKTVLIDESQTVSNLIITICQKIGITKWDEYSLLRESTEKIQDSSLSSNKTPLKRNGKEKKIDLKINELKKKLKTDDQLDWIDPNKTLHEQGIDQNQILIFRKRFFFSDQNIDTRDPIQLNLLYVQTRNAIIDGTFPVTLDMSCRLAGIQCQIQFGDHIEGQVKPEVLDLQKFLPKDFLRTKEVLRKILTEHRKHSGDDEFSAKDKYLFLARSLDTYGVTFFLVEEKKQRKKKLVPILLGISKDGIFRLNAKTKEIIMKWSITSVKRWVASPNTITFDFGDYSDGYYSVRTKDSEKISEIISSYIDIILRHKKPNDYLGVECDPLSKISEHNIYPMRANFNIVEYTVQRAIKLLETKTDISVYSAELGLKQCQMDGRKKIVFKQLDSLISATKKIMILTSLSRNDELDFIDLDSQIHSITTDITQMSQEIKVIVDLMENSEKKEIVKNLTKKLFISFSELLIWAETTPKNSSKKQLNISNEINKVSYNLKEALKGLDIIEIETEDIDVMLKLSELVSNACNRVVSKAEYMASLCYSDSLKNNVIISANECKTSVSKLLICVELYAHDTNLLNSENQNQFNEVMIAVENMTKLHQYFNKYEDLNREFKTETAILSQTLNNLRDHLKSSKKIFVKNFDDTSVDTDVINGTLDYPLIKGDDSILPIDPILNTFDTIDGRLIESNEALNNTKSLFNKTENLDITNRNESNRNHDILDLRVKQLVNEMKGNEETVSQSFIPNKIISFTKELVEALTKLVQFVENCQHRNPKISKSSVLSKSIASYLRNETKLLGYDSINHKIMAHLKNSVSQVLYLAKETIALANGCDNNNNNNFSEKDIEEKLFNFSCAVSKVELLIKDTQIITNETVSHKIVQLINACQPFLKYGFSLVSIPDHIIGEFTDKSNIIHMIECIRVFTESLVNLQTEINEVHHVFSSLINFEKTIDFIQYSYVELEECQRTINEDDIKQISWDGFECCNSRLNFTCNSVGSTMFELITAVTQSNYNFIVNSLRDICNSTRNFIKSIISITAIPISKDIKIRVIVNARRVLENLILLINEMKDNIWGNCYKVRDRRLAQIIEEVISSLNSFSDSSSMQDNMNESDHIITYKSEFFIEFLRNSSYSFSNFKIKLSTDAVKTDETTSELFEVSEDQNASPTSMQDSKAGNFDENVNENINEIVKDLDKAKMLANSSNLNTNITLSVVKTDEVLEIGKELVENMKLLIAGLMSNQNQLIITTQNCMTTVVRLTETVKLRAFFLGTTNSEAQTLLLDAVKDVVITFGELIKATNKAYGECHDHLAMIDVKEKVRIMFSKVASLLETDQTFKDEQNMDEKALKTAIESIDQELKAFDSEKKSTLGLTESRDLFKDTISVTLATDKALHACSTGQNFDTIVAANMGRKAISDLLITVKNFKSESQEMRDCLFKAAKSCAFHYRNILLLLQKTIEKTSERIDVKHQMLVLSRIIYTCVAQILVNSNLNTDSDYLKTIENKVIDDNESFDTDITYKESSNPQTTENSIQIDVKEISFDEMILGAVKSIITSALDLIKFISAAQNESIIDRKINGNELIGNECSDELITTARHLATVTHGLVEEVIGLVRDHSIEKQYSNSVSVGKVTFDSKSIYKLKYVGNAVKKAKDDFIKSAQQTFERNG